MTARASGGDAGPVAGGLVPPEAPPAVLADAELLVQVRTQPVPRHVAIIMDGNGRWARSRNLPRVAGHREGVKAAREAVRA